jgi:hypothetical protein
MTWTCLFDPAAALPTDSNGKSPMQPVCARRLRIGYERLMGGARADDVQATSKALDDIAPLLACQYRNDGLPCAFSCINEAERVTTEFQEVVLRIKAA